MKWKKFKKKRVEFSFIIPAHNEEKVISRCLKSILRQKGNYEIIVVNDGSTDRTREIVEKYMKRSKKIKLINFSKGHSAAFARNKGSKIARGEYIVFIDADQIVEKKFLMKIKKFLKKNPGIDGSDYLIFSYKPKTIFQRAWSAYRRSYHSIGLIHIVKRDVFRELNGFNEKIFYYEDTEFKKRFHKAGYVFKGPINTIVYHIEVENWEDFLRQRKWQAKGIHSLKMSKLTSLRYFGPLLLLPLCIISPFPLILYLLIFWCKFVLKSKDPLNSFLWVVIDYTGRLISLWYYVYIQLCKDKT